MIKKLNIFLVSLLIAINAFGAGLDTNTRLYLPFDENTLGATTVDGALEVLDYGSGGNIITQVETAAYQTAVTKVWNASVDLDGNSDYLEMNGLTTTLANDTTGAIAFWFRYEDIGGYKALFTMGDNGSAARTDFYIDNIAASAGAPYRDTLYMAFGMDGTAKWAWLSDEYTIVVNQWHHVMVSHDGTSPTIYYDGVDVTTSAGSFITSTDLTEWMKGLLTDATTNCDVVDFGVWRNNGSTYHYMDGQAADLRIWSNDKTSANATTLYGGGSGTTASIDDDEVFWIQGTQDQSGDGGSDTYHVPDYVGTAQLDTAQKLSAGGYSSDTSSLILDGNSDKVTVPDSADWDLAGSATQDYTIDFWVKHTDHAGYEAYICQYTAVNNNKWLLRRQDSGGIYFLIQTTAGAFVNVTTGVDITDTDWHHISICKATSSGPTVEYGVYLDSIQIAYASDATTATYTLPLTIGDTGWGTSTYLDGNIAQVRIQASNIFSASPNVGKTDTITVPTAPYTYVAPASGWTHIINSVANASIAKINGVAKASIAEVNQT